MELERPGPSYTVDTLEALHAEGRIAGAGLPDPWLILSVETLPGLVDWHRPERLLELCRIAVVPRRGYDGAQPTAGSRSGSPVGRIGSGCSMDPTSGRPRRTSARGSRRGSLDPLPGARRRGTVHRGTRPVWRGRPTMGDDDRVIDEQPRPRRPPRDRARRSRTASRRPSTESQGRPARRGRVGLARRPRRAATSTRRASDRDAVPVDPEALALAHRIVDLAVDKKASDIVLIDIHALTSIADYLVICSGGSERQLGGITSGIIEALKDEGSLPYGREGGPSAHWALIDYGSVVVHVMATPERDFYQLEKLWSDAPLLLHIQ